MTFDHLLPTFLSTAPPGDGDPISLPFKFVGGFGFDNQTIGVILSVQGFYSILMNTFLFPWATKRFGESVIFKFVR